MPDHSTEIAEYSKFYKENVERLIAFLMLQGWTRLDAADCVQETLIVAAQVGHDREPGGLVSQGRPPQSL